MWTKHKFQKIKNKWKRGIYVKRYIQDYYVLDIEATALSWQEDHIIKIGIFRKRNH